MTELLHPRPMNRSVLAFVTVALALMYALCVMMFAARVRNSGEWTYFFVPGNLALAWLPLLFAILCHQLSETTTPLRRTLAVASGALWLLFLPNAPYVLTDLQHYQDSPLIAGWYDGLMLGAFVATGMLLGLFSLYLMHGVLAKQAGATASWIVMLAAMPLCGFGIYVGRVLRWNSWDAIVAPGTLVADLTRVATDPLMRSEAFAMTVGFGAFLAASYVTLYAIAAIGSPIARGMHDHATTPDPAR
ncbi:MAG TPA: DUF1361 domain-containing protein [Dehalococcoidia bacterium]|nr:DUF1361 domain-containing protein [Dehalococcoidia bacterium]